jgi:hypothetical protein
MFNILKKTPIMEFMCHPTYRGVIPEPKPAAKFMPDWFKKIPISMDDRDHFGGRGMTLKQCMPVMDVMSLGYVITLQGDLGVSTNADKTEIKVTNPPELALGAFHDIKQVGEMTAPGFPTAPLKFLNHWVIKTAPGWSTLVMPLMNRFEKDFTCLSGLVDTDRYTKEINFPAVWHTPDFDDIIPAGTPLVVVVPIKRKIIPTKPIIRDMTTAEFDNIELIRRQQQTRRHVYSHELREPRK